MRICVLASGSSGNALYVEAAKTKILVDQGLSLKSLTSRMREVGLNLSGMSGILVSHEHRDHCAGIGVLANRWKVPLYMTTETHKVLARFLKGSPEVIHIKPGKDYWIGDIFFHPFIVSHDAVDPVQFTFTDGSAKVSMATDLGYVSRLVYEKLKGSDLVILESNHDERMLIEGPYPWFLKQRIRSREGHLSNHDAACVLVQLAEEGLKSTILAHLSEENNTPNLALGTAKTFLEDAGFRDFHLELGNQRHPGNIITI